MQSGWASRITDVAEARPRTLARRMPLAVTREVSSCEICMAFATSGVVDIERKWKTEKDVLSSIVAMPVPARDVTPRRPTKAVSISDSNGSSAKAPSAGIAKDTISRVIDALQVGVTRGLFREFAKRLVGFLEILPRERVKGVRNAFECRTANAVRRMDRSNRFQ